MASVAEASEARTYSYLDTGALGRWIAYEEKFPAAGQPWVSTPNADIHRALSYKTRDVNETIRMLERLLAMLRERIKPVEDTAADSWRPVTRSQLATIGPDFLKDLEKEIEDYLVLGGAAQSSPKWKIVAAIRKYYMQPLRFMVALDKYDLEGYVALRGVDGALDPALRLFTAVRHWLFLSHASGLQLPPGW